MPEPAPRIAAMNATNARGSDGWEVFYRARALRDAGLPVTDLTIGEPDTRTDPAILRAMSEAAQAGHTGYAMVPGTQALRDAVAARVTQRTGVATRRDNVLITPGGQAALFACHMLACAPGDTALFIDPCYTTYPGLIRAASARAHAIVTRPEAGFLPDPAAIDAAARETGARALLINTPNNPTGAVYPRATLQGIAEVARTRDLWLISDEVYEGQVWQGAHVSPRALPGMAERTLVVGSFSKSHAMTGSRLGWVVGPDAAIAHLVDLATVTTYGVPGYIQDAGLFALNRGAALEEAVSAPFARRRRIAEALLSGHTTPRLLPAQGAMYLMLDIRGTGLSGTEFADALLAAEGIAVMPGESFGQAATGHIRVAMTVEDAAFRDALGRLARFAAARAA